MKYIYYVATVEENGKYYDFVYRSYNGDLVINHCIKHHIKTLIHCKTKKQADEITQRHNAIYKAQGGFLFDNPGF